MQLITKKNITVEKLQELKRNGCLFLLATKEGIVVVKLAHLSGNEYMVHSAAHSSHYITMYQSRGTYLKGTCEVLVDFIKTDKYTVFDKRRLL